MSRTESFCEQAHSFRLRKWHRLVAEAIGCQQASDVISAKYTKSSKREKRRLALCVRVAAFAVGMLATNGDRADQPGIYKVVSVFKGLYELVAMLLGLVPLLRTKELASAAMRTEGGEVKGKNCQYV